MFSPMVAMAWVISSATVRPVPGNWALRMASTSSPTCRATWAMPSTSAWNASLRPTKSVSELTSTIAAFVPLLATATRPSAATRPPFLTAADRPFLRSQSVAASVSPPASVSARLQSIMPAPVFSRRSLTIAAVISAIVFSYCGGKRLLRPSCLVVICRATARGRRSHPAQP